MGRTFSRVRTIFRELDPQNDVTFLRLRSKKHEILIAPGAPLNPMV